MTAWHSKARRVTGNDAGSFTGGGWKFCVHATGGKSLSAAIAAYRAKNSWPHFTLGVDPKGNRILVQHLPITVAARSLKHTLVPETNRANVIQVEVLGYAADSPHWTPQLYRYLRLLFVWCHRHAGIPLESHHPFIGQPGYHRLSGPGWVKTVGLVGHCHCPGNDHTDPGSLSIRKVLPA